MWNLLLDNLRELGLWLANILINFFRSSEPDIINEALAEFMKGCGETLITFARNVINLYVN